MLLNYSVIKLNYLSGGGVVSSVSYTFVRGKYFAKLSCHLLDTGCFFVLMSNMVGPSLRLMARFFSEHL
jgi:hypothetical protein